MYIKPLLSFPLHLLSVHWDGLGGGGVISRGFSFVVLLALGLLARVEENVVRARLDVGQAEAGHVCRPVLAVQLALHVAAVSVLVAGAGHAVQRLLLHGGFRGGGVVAHWRRTLALLRHHFRLLLLGCLQTELKPLSIWEPIFLLENFFPILLWRVINQPCKIEKLLGLECKKLNCRYYHDVAIKSICLFKNYKTKSYPKLII